METRWALSHSAKLRYATGALLYFAQGIPAGLLAIAIPVWLASQGVEAGDIATYLAIVSLPWAFKLLSGPIMDRFEFLPMGQRRPWVLAMQLGLCISLLAFAFIEAPTQQIWFLIWVGVLVNIFAATQDVATDGMAIDLTPLREQGRLNGFMAFGKTVGWGISSAISGFMLVEYGLGFTATVLAIASTIIWVMAVFVLERPGERRWPWSKGKAGSKAKPDSSFKGVFLGLREVLFTRASIVVLGIMFFDGLVHGYGHALMPIAAVELFGYTTPEWSQLVATMGLVGAGLGLLMGPLIDKIGSKYTLILTACLVVGHAFMLGLTEHLWQSTNFVRVMLAFWVMLTPLVMVSVIALGMSVCSSKVSATQFAIYMSTANLGSSLGAKIFGVLSTDTQTSEAIIILGFIAILPILALFLHRQEKQVRKRQNSYGLSLGETSGAVFWSGTIRCPKCRSDMEQVELDEVTVDRCLNCHGLWFDAGELHDLKQTGRVADLDTGKAKAGKKHDHIDDYPCPRCGGEMLALVDKDQTHIWFETCKVCKGSYFDAGEIRDLAELNWFDTVKGWMAPKRG